jgi:hypothetical protein
MEKKLTGLGSASILGMMSSVRWRYRSGWKTCSAILSTGSAARRPSIIMYSMAFAAKIKHSVDACEGLAVIHTSLVVIYDFVELESHRTDVVYLICILDVVTNLIIEDPGRLYDTA